MLIHGFMGSPEDFTPVAERLSANYPCIAPCLKGHGPLALNTTRDIKSHPRHFEEYLNPTDPWPYSLQAQAEHIENVLNQIGIDEIYGVGYSLGGRVALQWALGENENPRLKALCLTAAHTGLAPDQKTRQQRFDQDIQIAKRLEDITLAQSSIESWEAFLSFWYALPLFGRLQQHSNYAQLIQRRRTHNPQLLAEVILQSSNALQKDYRSALAKLAKQLPCLYIAGAEDHKYAKLATDLNQEGIPAVIIPGVAHALPVENSTRYGLLLQQFFASLRQ